MSVLRIHCDSVANFIIFSCCVAIGIECTVAVGLVPLCSYDNCLNDVKCRDPVKNQSPKVKTF